MTPLPRFAARTAVTTAALALLAPAVALPSQASPAGDSLVINEAYTNGGSANAVYTHKFVELYNPTDQPINLDGWSLQYRSAAGTAATQGTVALSGTVPAKGHFLVSGGSNGTAGAALPQADLVAGGAFNPAGTKGTIVLARQAGTVTDLPVGSVVTGQVPGVADVLGYGATNTFETAAAGAPSANSDPKSLTRTNGVDTDDNSADFTVTDQVTPTNAAATGGEPTPEPEPQPTPAERITIAQLQGTGTATPYAGRQVTTTGVVTAVYSTGGYDGYYIQTAGTGGDTPDATPGASDGVFVYSPDTVGSVTLGDHVQVTGEAAEHYGLTQIKVAAGGVLPVAEPGAVAPTPVEFPLEEADREALEGMVLAPQGDWTVTDNYSLNQYGSLGIVPGTTPLDNPTSVALPGTEAQAVAAANAQQLIVLDDGATTNFMRSPGNQNPLPYLDVDRPVRVGAGLEFTTGVILDWRFGAWSFQPLGHLTDATAAAVQPVTIEDTRPAEAAPEAVGGNVTVGSFNVLNYFTTLGQDVAGCSAYRDRAGNPVTTNGCLPRGAYTSEAFARQQEKIAAAINGLGTSVVALEEIENSEKFGLDRDHALAHLVEALNAQAGEQRWAYVASPATRPALADEDVIRSAFIYQPAEVTPVGESVILDDQTNFDNAREPMAQLFRAADGTSEGAAGTDFVAITNHFKSKGGSGATGDNVDAGDGQGAYNADRVGQAEALVAFAERMKAETGTDRVLLMGDFNAYEKEDPIRVLEAAGYLSQGALTGEYSYAFGGAVGSLDGIYASPSAATAITGQDIWMINANESVALEYSRHNYVAEDLYSADQWRSSDHNPILVGLQLDAPVTEPTPEPEPEPTPGETCDGVTDPRGVPGKPANSVREWLRCIGATPGHGGDHPGKGHGGDHPGKGRGPVRP
ncbi:ExeM/NucH family extracellular endonuclease [Micrococcus yunnanensis]|uniref:ExeM/NucH family extracellular endonuclease n=2 Tax=Bacillati TaxID=1783272 RepID=UPI001F1C01AB|nr:ExeM/NucH family extracellular endonuclease [Micrococcus yunnanensis]MCF8559969.1 ExeM/NucH family extracellular endonuclease [Micrococcus yunnanensis]